MIRAVAPCLVVSMFFGCSWSSSPVVADDGTLAARKRAKEIVSSSTTVFRVAERFDANGKFAYIELTSREPGRLATRWAVMPHGHVAPVSEAENAFNERHRSEWGSLDLESARKLVRSNSISAIRVMGQYDSRVVSSAALRPELISFDPSAYVSEYLSLFELRLERAELMRLAHRDGTRLLRILEDDPVSRNAVSYPSPVPSSQYIPSTSLTTNSDTFANANGYYGKSVKVGIVESRLTSVGMTDYGCALDEGHESMASVTSFTYQKPPMSCTMDTQCSWCGDTASYGKCLIASGAMSGVCVDVHASQVASRIAASQGAAGGAPAGEFHAAQASLYVEHNRSGASYSSGQIGSVFSWFSSNDVRLLNLSFGSPSPGHGFWAVHSDWYARDDGFIVVQAAGNKDDDDLTGAAATITCQGFDTICVGASTKNLQSPRTLSSYQMSPFSRFINLTDNDWEFEKPDVVAEGAASHVMEVGTVNHWLEEIGTSFSAPTVTGLIALHLDFCDEEPGTRDSAFYRAFLRTVAAYDPSVVELNTAGIGTTHVDSCPMSVSTPLYPNLVIGCDHKGGGGPVRADYMFRDKGTCGVIDDPECKEPPCPFSGTGVLDAKSGWSSVPSWAQSSNPGNNNSTLALRMPSAERVVLKQLGTWPERSRLRATFAYYACPASLMASAASSAPAVNFDLALVGTKQLTGLPEVIQASEAKNDATEGFDVTFPEEFTDVELWVVSPGISSTDWNACNGSKSEPFWWWAMGSPPP